MDDYVVLRGFLLQTSCVTAHAYHNIYIALRPEGDYDTFLVYKLISSELSIMLVHYRFTIQEATKKEPIAAQPNSSELILEKTLAGY